MEESKFKSLFEDWLDVLVDMYEHEKERLEAGETDEWDDPAAGVEYYGGALRIVCSLAKDFCPEFYDELKVYETDKEVTHEEKEEYLVQEWGSNRRMMSYDPIDEEEKKEFKTADTLIRELIGIVSPELADEAKLEEAEKALNERTTRELPEASETEKAIVKLLPDNCDEVYFEEEESKRLYKIFKKNDAENHDCEELGDDTTFSIYSYADRGCVVIDGALDCNLVDFSDEFQEALLDILKNKKGE